MGWSCRSMLKLVGPIECEWRRALVEKTLGQGEKNSAVWGGLEVGDWRLVRVSETRLDRTQTRLHYTTGVVV
jgi:hypothetical protein